MQSPRGVLSFGKTAAWGTGSGGPGENTVPGAERPLGARGAGWGVVGREGSTGGPLGCEDTAFQPRAWNSFKRRVVRRVESLGAAVSALPGLSSGRADALPSDSLLAGPSFVISL